MMKSTAIAFLSIYVIALAGRAACEVASLAAANPENEAILSELAGGLSDSDESNSYEKRAERYPLGLGRQAYTYTNGNSVKRLPVYNFGLGKRARPYSFGLGKRGNDYEDHYDASTYLDGKRNRPYSFGLGKRANLGRSQIDRYGFGLGR